MVSVVDVGFPDLQIAGPGRRGRPPSGRPGPAPVSPSLSFFTEEVDIRPLLMEQRKHFSSCVLVCERLRRK